MDYDNEELDRIIAIRANDELHNKYKESKTVHEINSGKFGTFIKFQKNLYRIFRKIDIKSPTAIRLYLYFIEFCLGYDNDPKSMVPFNRKKLMKECNIKTGKSLYDAINYLRSLKLIFLLNDYNSHDGKYIRINTFFKSWEVKEELKNKEYKVELDRIGEQRS